MNLEKIVILGMLGSVHIATAQEPRQPNIIFILTDDQRADAIGYAGNPIIHTPNIDELAVQGTYFRNAFATTPISAASRASILTGMYERSHEFTFQKGPLKQEYVDVMYPVVLRQNGYYTGYFGKQGVAIRHFTMLFDKAETYDRNDKKPNREGYFYKTIGSDTVHLTRYTGYQGQEFIKSVPPGRPFMLTLCFSAPHAHDPAPEQYFWQSKSNRLYANITIPDAPLTEEKYFMQLPKEVREGFNRTRWHWRYDTPEKYQHSMKGYYRMVSEIDDEVGEIRTLLRERGLEDNTIIIYLGDNGLFVGERQLAGKWLMHDLSLRVPLIVYDPRVNRHYDNTQMVLNIDVPRTILSFAGIESPRSYQGLDLRPLVEIGHWKEKRNAILFEHLWAKKEIPSSEAIRTEKWKYFRYRFIDAPEELYDLEADPMEIINLAQNPEYRRVVRRLRKELDRQIALRVSQKLLDQPTEQTERMGY